MSEWGSAEAFQGAIDKCRLDGKSFGECDDFVNLLTLATQVIVALLRSEAKPIGTFGKAHVGIVLTEQDTIFGTRGKHTIRLVYTLCYQIIDEYANVGFIAAEREGFAAMTRDVRIDTRHETLPRRLLIARGTIDLSGKKEAFDELRFQRMA